MLMNERALSLRLGETLLLVISVGHVQHKGPEAAVVIIIDTLSDPEWPLHLSEPQFPPL